MPSAFDTQIAGEVKNFDPTPAFPSPKEVRRTDRYSQFGVYAAWQALKDSGLDLDQDQPGGGRRVHRLGHRRAIDDQRAAYDPAATRARTAVARS